MNEPKQFDWGSRCAECGRVMPAGTAQRCTKGGWCSHHVPAAVNELLIELHRISQAIAHSTAQAMIPGNDVRREIELSSNLAAKAITKAEGKLIR